MYIVSSVSFMVVAVAASKNFHNKVFAAVLAAPVNLFFDVTPVGRILNRFGKDIDQIDILVRFPQIGAVGAVFEHSITRNVVIGLRSRTT